MIYKNKFNNNIFFRFVASETILSDVAKSIHLKKVESEDLFKLVPQSNFPEGIELLPTNEEMTMFRGIHYIKNNFHCLFLLNSRSKINLSKN